MVNDLIISCIKYLIKSTANAFVHLKRRQHNKVIVKILRHICASTNHEPAQIGPEQTCSGQTGPSKINA